MFGVNLFGPPTSLQNKSYLGLPASSCPQVAVAEIRDPSAILKYGGLKLNPVESWKDPCPFASLKSVIEKVTINARRWAPRIPLAMIHVGDPGRCWEQPAARRSGHLYISTNRLRAFTHEALSKRPHVRVCETKLQAPRIMARSDSGACFQTNKKQLPVPPTTTNQTARHTTAAIRCQCVDGLSSTPRSNPVSGGKGLVSHSFRSVFQQQVFLFFNYYYYYYWLRILVWNRIKLTI